MQAVEVGVRELQRSTSRVIAEVERGIHVVVAKQRRPVAVLIPVVSAAAWVLRYRPLKLGTWEDDEAAWLIEGPVRVAPGAEARFAAMREPFRGRLVARLRRLRRSIAAGRVVVREGQVWALAEFEVEDPLVTLAALGRRVELERQLGR